MNRIDAAIAAEGVVLVDDLPLEGPVESDEQRRDRLVGRADVELVGIGEDVRHALV